MSTSKKLEIIYHNGQPDGIRSIRRNLSTMTTYLLGNEKSRNRRRNERYRRRSPQADS